jgi:hypothetical protein
LLPKRKHPDVLGINPIDFSDERAVNPIDFPARNALSVDCARRVLPRNGDFAILRVFHL